MKPRISQLDQSGAADGDVVTWDDTAGEWVPAAGGGGGALDDLTDVDTTGVADGDVLTYDSASGLWVPAAPSGGGGGGGQPNFTDPLDLDALDATYGDEFTGTSLNARWTRRNIVSGDETWQQEKGAYAVKTTGLTGGDMYLQTAPAGDWSITTSFTPQASVATFLVGPVAVSSTGAGIGAFVREGNGIYLATLSGYTWSAYGNFVPGSNAAQLIDHRGHFTYWIKLRKSGTSYFASWSLGGKQWSVESAATTQAATIDRFGIGCAFIDSGTGLVVWRRFNFV